MISPGFVFILDLYSNNVKESTRMPYLKDWVIADYVTKPFDLELLCERVAGMAAKLKYPPLENKAE